MSHSFPFFYNPCICVLRFRWGYCCTLRRGRGDVRSPLPTLECNDIFLCLYVYIDRREEEFSPPAGISHRSVVFQRFQPINPFFLKLELIWHPFRPSADRFKGRPSVPLVLEHNIIAVLASQPSDRSQFLSSPPAQQHP